MALAGRSSALLSSSSSACLRRLNPLLLSAACRRPAWAHLDPRRQAKLTIRTHATISFVSLPAVRRPRALSLLPRGRGDRCCFVRCGGGGGSGTSGRVAMASAVRNAGVLALFDVDGTLTAPRKVPPPRHRVLLLPGSVFPSPSPSPSPLPPPTYCPWCSIVSHPCAVYFFPHFCRIIVCFSV
jgi:hypothetical protein